MGVKYSQLPIAADVASDDYVAILDVSEGVLKRCEVNQIAGGVTVDQTLDVSSTNPIANSPVAVKFNQNDANLGLPETSSVAIYKHDAGEYFLWNGQFVKATANIPIGGTISSSNTQAKTVSNVLNEIAIPVNPTNPQGNMWIVT